MGVKPLAVALLSHAASPRSPTGAERSLALLARGLGRLGHRVAVAVPGPWALEGALTDVGVQVVRIPSRSCWLTYYEPRPLPVAAAKWLRYAWPDRSTSRLAAWLRETGPDVVHVNCLPHLRGAEAARRAGIPVAWHVREILPAGWRRRRFADRLRRRARRVIAVSRAVAGWLEDEGLGERVRVVHNGSELGAVEDPRAARNDLGLPGDGVLVGLFGQLMPHKGVLEFVAAARSALERQPSLRFVIAGPGPEGFLDRVLRAVGNGAPSERFHVLPPRPSAARLIAATDVVALTTMTPDPFPRAVLEAMAAGRPVAAFRSGGTPEMIAEGENGLMVATGDVEGLAAAFVRLAEDAGLRERMGRAGRSAVAERFSVEIHLARMEGVLRETAEAGDAEG